MIRWRVVRLRSRVVTGRGTRGMLRRLLVGTMISFSVVVVVPLVVMLLKRNRCTG